MERQIVEIKDLKEGKYVIIDGEACKILKIVKSKPGKHGAAKARIDAIGLFDNQKRSIVAPVDQRIEVPIIKKSPAQVLNIVGNTAQLMDLESYETFELEIPEEFKDKLTPGGEVLCMSALGKRKIIQA
ncbi:MAG TPA: translation initiation factor IF-5A [Candidatus Altiarchaeales archaeon]|nr:MAG: translation initiation factor IF-5A [Candidatus Altiarchaeales archaeon]HDN83182.1 translation initiation factor IF-5A [Candidatus Altiarchaeales archaeon]